MRHTPGRGRRAVGMLALTVSLSFSVAACDGSIPLPSIEIPSFELPSIEIPSFELPSIEIPTFELPTRPQEPWRSIDVAHA